MPFSPTDIATIVGWWKADSISASDGDQIAAWADSSGNGFVTEQPFGFKPTYETNEINSLPVLRFGSGGDKVLRCGAQATQAAQTLFALIRPTGTMASGVQKHIRAPDNGGLDFRIDGNGNLALVKSGTGTLVTGATTLTTSTTYVVAGSFTASTSATVYLNGTEDATASHAQAMVAGTYSYIGAAGLFGSEPFIGDIAELITYSSVLSTTDRDSVTSYLGTKYAITVAVTATPSIPLRSRLNYGALLQV